jgi:hypothetical protein
MQQIIIYSIYNLIQFYSFMKIRALQWCGTRLQLNHKLDVSVRQHTWQFLGEDIGKLIDHWHLRSLTSI